MDCPLHDERLTLAGLFFEAHTGLVAELERRLEADSGLTVQWFEVLLRLARSPDHRLRMSELAAQVSLTPSGLTRVVDRLEGEGYVKRGMCPGDRRGMNAILTPKGLKRVEGAVPKHIEHLDQLFTGTLTEKERTALESALRKVRDTLNPCALVGTETPPRR